MKHKLIAKAAALGAFLFAVPAFAGNGANLLPYLPSGSDVVVSIDVENLRTSPTYQQVWSMVEALPDYQEALAEMSEVGFNPATDISTMMVAGSSAAGDDEMVLLVEGNFNRPAIEGVLQAEEGAEAHSLGALTYFTHDGEIAAFLNDTTVVFGQEAWVMPALSVASGAPNGAGLAGTMQTQASAAVGSSTMWFAGLVPAEVTAASPEMAGVEAYRGTLDLTSGLATTIAVITDTAERATTLAGELNTQIQEAQAVPEVAAFGLTPVVQSMQAVPNGNEVSLSIAIDQATLTTLSATLGAIMQQQMQ